MDKETAAILTDADHVKSLLDSQCWTHIKRKFDERILDLQSIANLDMTKPETLAIQLAARTMAVQEMFSWMKNDVYGFVEQQEANNKKVEEKLDSFIERR